MQIKIDESKSSLLLFDIVSTTFIPGKILSEKGVEVKVHCQIYSVLRYIPDMYNLYIVRIRGKNPL
jgi:hypothetical protein